MRCAVLSTGNEISKLRDRSLKITVPKNKRFKIPVSLLGERNKFLLSFVQYIEQHIFLGTLIVKYKNKKLVEQGNDTPCIVCLRCLSCTPVNGRGQLKQIHEVKVMEKMRLATMLLLGKTMVEKNESQHRSNHA